METRRIGALETSVVGLGCNNFGWHSDEAATGAVVGAALDAGVTFFDTADIYGGTKSEEFLGRVLAGRRDRVVLASKFGIPVDDARPGGAKPDYVRRALEDSLRRLRTDRLDLYQLHRPDPETPIADTLGALADLVRAGKVREIGCSNFTVAQLREAASVGGDVKFASVQNEYSLLHRGAEADVLPECAHTGVAFLPYFPLASGLLTGKYRAGQPLPAGTRIQPGGRFGDLLAGETLALVESLTLSAQAHGHTLLELAFAWLLAHPAVASVIAGATSAAQVTANAAAAHWRLTPAEMDEVGALLAGRSLP